MKSNSVRARLRQGDACIGTWLTLPDPLIAQLMARTGFDWLTIELEHSPTSFESAAQSFAMIASAGCVPLTRVPWNTGENIKRVLDTGAWGVVVPMVNSKAEAEAAVAAARYAPQGQRSIGGLLHATNFDTDASTYYAKANGEILVVLMVEHVDAVANLDEIAAVPGIDVLFIGPNDLHNSMGRAPSFESDDPRFISALDKVLAVCRKHGIAPGIHVVDGAAAKRRMDEGFRFIAVASEAGFLLAKSREILNQVGRGGKKEAAKY